MSAATRFVRFTAGRYFGKVAVVVAVYDSPAVVIVRRGDGLAYEFGISSVQFCDGPATF